MNDRKFPLLSLAGATLVALSMVFACGGLDDRKVTRVPDDVGPGVTTDGGAPPVDMPSAGAAEGGGTAVDQNPFGGETFTGGAPPVLDGPPEVVDVAPADGAVDVDPIDSIGLKFSEGLEPSTVTLDSVRLLDGTAAIPGKLTYAGVTATLKPTAHLSLLGSYEIQATQALTDLAGQSLQRAFSSKFTVREGIWGARQSPLTDQATWGAEQDVGIDAQGNVLVVWSTQEAQTATTTGCWAARYSVKTGWAAPVAVSEPAEDCYNLRLAVGANGDAVIAWFTGQYPDQAVRARRYVNGAWELAPTTVDSPPGTQSGVADLAVAVGGGQGLLAWLRGVTDGPPSYKGANYLYLSAGGLDAPWPATPSIGHIAYTSAAESESLANVGAALDPQGNALVLFSFSSNSTVANPAKGVYFARKAPGSDWQASAKIPSSVPSNYVPVVVSDGDGAMALWVNYDDPAATFQLFASRYTKTKQFTAPVQIQDPDLKENITLSSTHAVSSDGKSFFATWTQVVGASRNAYVSRYDIASGRWDSLPNAVSDGVIPVGDVSTIGVDAHGNAIVAFDQGYSTTTSSQISWARYTASTGRWSAAEPIAETEMWFRAPYVSVASNGTASLLFSSIHYIGRQAERLGCELRLFQ